jgi:hypothetical protein
MKMPKKLFMDYDVMFKSPLATAFREIGENWTSLALFLIHEKYVNENSFWKPYMG